MTANSEAYLGSGVIVSTDGYIVTNNHVVSGASDITVTLSNGQMYNATIVGTDATTDLAVIQLQNPPSDLTAASFGDSDSLAVGEEVLAIGNPLGYDNSATSGIISALNRPVSVVDEGSNSQVVTNAIQIDAAINQGNSGGPTFNAAGQVIGINSSIASTSTSSESAGSIGIGFAIPSNLVYRVMNEIIENGSVKHVVLGVSIVSATVTADGVTRGGAQITASSSTGSGVTSGSAADKAGLQTGDTIVAFNGKAVTNSYSLLGYVRAAALGDTATLTIVRGDSTLEVEVTFDQVEDTSSSSSSNSNNNNQNNQQNNNNAPTNPFGNNSEDDSDEDQQGFFDPFGLW